MQHTHVLRSLAVPVLVIGSLLTAAGPTTPDAAIAAYFTARFHAMDGAGPSSIALISSANPKLNSYAERDLVGLRQLLASFPNPIDRSHAYRVDGQNALQFKVYEETLVRWDDGPNGVRTSRIGYAHVIDLTAASAGGYLVAR